MTPTMTMTTSTGRGNPNRPTTDPLPDAIKAPKKIRDASAAYASALDRLHELEDARRAAHKRFNKTTVRDHHAKTRARREGRPSPDPEAPAARGEQLAIARERDQALAEATRLELEFTALVAEEREHWLAEIRDSARDAHDAVERQLEQLAEAIAHSHGLQVLEKRLASWRHDHTAGPKLRAQQLHSSDPIWHLRLADAARAQGRPVARLMKRIEVEAKKKPQ